jgi:hypothetical protein
VDSNRHELSPTKWGPSRLLSALVLALVCPSITAAAGDAIIIDPDLAQDIPIRLSPLHVFFDVRINGSEPLNFAFDTGSPMPVLDEDVARRLGLEGEGEFNIGGGGAGTLKASKVRDLSFEFPGVECRGRQAVVTRLSMLGQVGGESVDGILGYDLMRDFVVEIDYAASRMRIHDPDTFEYQGDGHAIPIENRGRMLRVIVSVTMPGREPVDCAALLDSGADLNFLFTSPYVRKQDLLGALSETTKGVAASGVGGLIQSRAGRIESIEIGPYAIENPNVSFSEDVAGAGASNDVDGILGAGLLSCFKVTYDLSRSRMMLEPNMRPDAPVTMDLLGVRWKTVEVSDEIAVVAVEVRAGSSAESAGIQVGDALELIDGDLASEMGLSAIRRFFRTAVDETQLDLVRNGELIEMGIKLTTDRPAKHSAPEESSSARELGRPYGGRRRATIDHSSPCDLPRTGRHCRCAPADSTMDV